MRTIRVYQFFYICFMLILDTIITTVFKQFGFSNIMFIGNLHFMALLLLTQSEPREDSLIKAFIVGLWMDVTHVGTFPTFTIAYTLTMLIVRVWDRYVGFSVFEFIVAVIISLFVKEVILYVLIVLLHGLQQSLVSFIGYRVFWVVLGNLLFIPIVRWGYYQMHQHILKRAQNMYIR